MLENTSPIKLWRYALLYLGIQITASCLLVLLSYLFSFMASAQHSMLSVITVLVAGQMTVYQYYKKNKRLMTWPEIHRVVTICGIVYTVIIFTFLVILSLFASKQVGIGGVILISILASAMQWGFLYLSFYAGRKLVQGQIKRLSKLAK